MQATIEIAKSNADRIQQLAKLRNVTEAELMQFAINDWLQQQDLYEHHQKKRALQAGFGLWKGNADVTDGMSYQTQIRAEWDS